MASMEPVIPSFTRLFHLSAFLVLHLVPKFSGNIEVEEDLQVYLGELKRFSLLELQVATENFSNKNILGGGGFGKVYKGNLTRGELVAIERLFHEPTKVETICMAVHRNLLRQCGFCMTSAQRVRKVKHSQGGDLQFRIQVAMINKIVHPNLLRLLGFCMTRTKRFLVYPFMVNGSVATSLRDRSISQPPLEWSIRRRIALGAARGLAYMHGHSDPKLIHCDVKADNIFLDENFEAVVGGFGFAKLMNYIDTHDNDTISLCGTFGHMPPEYLSTGQISEKTDVFGYGVMLLEIIVGQRACDFARRANDHDLMFLDWVKVLVKGKRLKELVDVALEENYDLWEAEEIIQVALLCTQDSPLERPKMSEVVRMLEGDGVDEKWDQWWQKEDMIQQNSQPANLHTTYWPSLSTPNTQSGDLSGSRYLNRGNILNNETFSKEKDSL